VLLNKDKLFFWIANMKINVKQLCTVILGAVFFNFSYAIDLLAVTIDSQVIRNESGDGVCLVSNGFPLPPGLVFEKFVNKRNIIILINNIEVPAHVSALRGAHNDGSLRSILIQFNAPLIFGQTVKAEVIVGENVRAYPDLPYQKPTLEIVKNNNIIVPINPDYLCSTMLTFRRLLPVGKESVGEGKFFTNLSEDRFDELVKNQNRGTADYENVSAMLAMWCRFGDVKFLNQALHQTLEWLDYNTPHPQHPKKPCRADKVANPDGRIVSHNHCGLPAEWHFPRAYSYAQMYLMTGYRDFWGTVAYLAQFGCRGVTDRETALEEIIKKGSYDTPRFNYVRYGAMIPALMIDATIKVDSQWFSGQKIDWENQMDWTIDALEHSAWDLKWIPFDNGTGEVPKGGTLITQGEVSAYLLGVYNTRYDPRITKVMPKSGFLQVNNVTGGSFQSGMLENIECFATGPEEEDYRQGIVGLRSNSWRAPNTGGSNPITVIPVFQLTFPSNFLIDYYLYVKKDDRIPIMVKSNLDAVLENISPLVEKDKYYKKGSGKWGIAKYKNPYALTNPISDNGAPYELPQYARMCAFVLKTLGNETINGATYAEWYERLIDTGNVNPSGILLWQWKIYGQFYGWSQDAPWMMAQESFDPYLSIIMKTPFYYDSIPN
jgi:hypothetical protein